MAPRERYVHDRGSAVAFDHASDFNEQLYRALKQSPWWMISIGVHVLLFVISSLLGTTPPPTARTPVASIEMTSAEDLLDVEPPDVPEDEPLVADDVDAKEPTVLDLPEKAEKPETDANLDHNDVYGNVLDGKAAGDFTGVSNSA